MNFFPACLVPATAFALAATEIAAPWSDTFSGKKRSEIIRWATNGVTLVPENGRTILLLDPARIPRVDAVMKGIRVNPKQKYRVSFEVRLDGPDTIEENPQIEFIALDPMRAAKGKPLPGWRLQFRDAAGKTVRRAAPPTWTVFFTGRPVRYSETFYPPPNAETLEIIFSCALNEDNKIRIDKMKCETPDEGALNINPEFREGKFNFSGWNCGKNTRLISSDNRVLLDSENGWILQDPVPVQSGREYQLEVAMTDRGNRQARAGMWLLGDDLKKKGELKQVLVFPGSNMETKSMRFVVPEHVSYVRPSAAWGVIHSLKLTQVQKQ